jgi:hypothetical protein
MNCPKCNVELLKTTDTIEEIIPVKELGIKFPIEIIVITTDVYKCECGTIVKIPEIKHYKEE